MQMVSLLFRVAVLCSTAAMVVTDAKMTVPAQTADSQQERTHPACADGVVDNAACGGSGVYQSSECVQVYVQSICPVFCGVCTRPACTLAQVDDAACGENGVYQFEECTDPYVQGKCPVLCNVCTPPGNSHTHMHTHTHTQGGSHDHAVFSRKGSQTSSKGAKMGKQGKNAAIFALRQPIPWMRTSTVLPDTTTLALPESVAREEAEDVAAGGGEPGTELGEEAEGQGKEVGEDDLQPGAERSQSGAEEPAGRLSWEDKVSNYNSNEGSGSDDDGSGAAKTVPYGQGLGKGDYTSNRAKISQADTSAANAATANRAATLDRAVDDTGVYNVRGDYVTANNRDSSGKGAKVASFQQNVVDQKKTTKSKRKVRGEGGWKIHAHTRTHAHPFEACTRVCATVFSFSFPPSRTPFFHMFFLYHAVHIP